MAHRRLVYLLAPSSASLLATAGGSFGALCESGEGVVASENGWRLKKVQIVFRHGARTPVWTIDHDEEWDACDKVNASTPLGAGCALRMQGVGKIQPLHLTDLTGTGPRPYSGVDARQMGEVLKGGCRRGQLTDLGAKQAAELGASLHRRYEGYLRNEDGKGPKVSARTTNVARCVSTLQFVLGSFMPNTDTIVPTATTSHSKEYLTPNTRSCARMRALFAEGMARWQASSQDLAEAENVRRELREKLPQHVLEEAPLGLEKYNFVRIRDHLMCVGKKTDSITRTLPWGISKELFQRIDDLAALQVATYIGYNGRKEEGVRVGIGKFLGEIVDGAQVTPDEDSSRVHFHFISGHDTTIL